MSQRSRNARSENGKATADKVVAYITDGEKLLVFSHPQHSEAGIQVPGGTVEAGEALDDAVLREVREETGLNNLEIRSYLGFQEYDLSTVGLSGILRRHFFHLAVRGQAPERWRHYEHYPSDGSTAPIEFEFFWASFPDRVPELAGGQGEFLHKLVIATSQPEGLT